MKKSLEQILSNNLHPGVQVWHHFWTAPFKKYKVNVCELSGLAWRNYHTLMTQRDFRLNRPDPQRSMTAWLAIFLLAKQKLGGFHSETLGGNTQTVHF